MHVFCFVLKSCSPPLKIKGHIVVGVYFLTTTLFLWLWSLNCPTFWAKLVHMSPWTLRNGSHEQKVGSISIKFSFICWFNNLTMRDRNCLNNIVKVCSKMIGMKLPDLSSLWEKRVLQKAKIMLNYDHVLVNEFALLPSGRRYSLPPRKTNHYAKSFLPSAVGCGNWIALQGSIKFSESNRDAQYYWHVIGIGRYWL